VTVGNDIARVRSDFVNGPRVKTQGLDFAIDYKVDVATATTLSAGAQASYITKYDIADFIFRGVTLQKGYTARGFTNYFRDPGTVSKLRATAFANLKYADLNLRANYRFVTDDRCPALPAPCTTTADGFSTNFGRKVRD
jgi:iron complex outermembrane receptor protein